MESNVKKNSIKTLIDTVCFDDDKMNLLLKEIGIRITKERVEQNFTIRELADICNFDTSSMYRIEKGQSDIKVSTILKVCIALNKSIDYFIPLNEEVVKGPSIGERFEQMVSGLSPKDVNMILNMVSDICQLHS